MSLQVGSQGPLVLAWQRVMNQRFPFYSREQDGGPLREDSYYGYSDRDVCSEWQRRTGRPVTGVVSDEELDILNVKPPPPLKRHACLTFRGTGGVVGQDYTSRVAQACAATVEEVPIMYPAAMGGFPVGTANDPNAPSGQKCVDIGFEMACDWFEANPTRTVVLGSYSLGAIAASRVRAEMLPGGRLEKYAPNYVCGFAFANPCRAFGHTFYLGAVPGGQGISSFHVPQEACTWDWCELVNLGDMYADAPTGEVGDVLRQGYRMVLDTTVSDPAGTAAKLIPTLLRMLDEAGVQLPLNIPGIMTGAFAGLLAALLPGVPTNNNETAAAVQAAVVAMKFYGSQPPTLPHITYEFAEATPGVTFLQLAIQHVNDWAGKRAVTT